MGILPTPQIINNLYISTSSADTLASAFKPLLERTIFEQWIFPLLTLIIAIAAVIVAYYAYKTSYNSFVNGILKLFFDITMSLPQGANARLSNHHKQLICNYFDYVAYLIESRQLKQKDVMPLTTVMKQSLFINFMIQYRRRGGNTLLDAYWRWHLKNP